MLQIPTDTIYKFLAIFGVALAVSSVGFVYKEIENYREIDSRLARLNTEIDFRDTMATHAVTRYESDKKRLFEKVAQGQPISPNEREHFKSTVDKLEQNASAYCALVGEAVPKIKELKVSQKYSPYYFFAGGILFAVGGIIAAFGFRSWHANSKSGQHEPTS